MQFSPTSSHFMICLPKYSPMHPVLITLYALSLMLETKFRSRSLKTTDKIIKISAEKIVMHQRQKFSFSVPCLCVLKLKVYDATLPLKAVESSTLASEDRFHLQFQ
jgi:hypothetical protein